ncbi:hypothetical protein [Myroides sp. LJL119]
MLKKIGSLLGACLVLLLFSCTEKLDIKAPSLSFYYWRTIFELDSVETDYVKSLNINKLYVRYFDVGLKNGKAIPISPIIFKDTISQQVVPVVFIKNEVVFQPNVNLDALSDNIVQMIDQINHKNNIEIQEIQLDCDWSGQSKEAFFTLVEKVKHKSQKKVSSTIRLHQVKYANKTGIAPVDYGTLMYYNMGSISADTLNSIYDRQIALKYINSLKTYSLPLKYALPIYSWTIHINQEKVLGLLQGLSTKELQENPDLTQIGTNRFLVTKQTRLKGKVLFVGQELKLEILEPKELSQMILDLQKASGRSTPEIILYDLNSNNLKLYEKEFLQTLVDYN